MRADRTAIAWRKGRCITKIESRRGLDTMEITSLVGKIIREDKPAKVNIDVGGLGIGVFDRLMELGHSRSVVNAVNFGSKPIEPPPLDESGKPSGGPANRRSELCDNMKKVLEASRFSLPDDDSLQADLVSCGYKYTSDGRLLLESKIDMRKRRFQYHPERGQEKPVAQRFGNFFAWQVGGLLEKGARVHGDGGVQPSDLIGCARFGRHTRPHMGDAEGASAEPGAAARFPCTHCAFGSLDRVTFEFWRGGYGQD